MAKPFKRQQPAQERAAGRKSRPKSHQRNVAGWLLRWGFVAAVWAGVILTAAVAWYSYDLPDLDRLETPTRRPNVTLAAADGTVIAAYGDLYGRPVRIEDVPPYLVQAIVATEDRRFFEHPGFDPFAVVRAMIVNLSSGRIRQGGSTITQQVAKNLFLTPRRTMRRKVQEFLIAQWLEAKFTKRQIFTIYLNRVYLGAGAYGVDAAARRYFGASARRINLHQAALLAGLLKAPSRYSPLRDAGVAGARARLVLRRMVAAGHIDQAQARRAAAQPLGLTAGRVGGQYFSDWVLERAASYVGHADQDLFIRTTLDPRLQSTAEQLLKQALEGRGKAVKASQGALLTISPDGAVRAMVGGLSYRHSQFNRATQALRQPGSAFKLFVYLAALEKGFRPDDTMPDVPISINKWRPRNYDGRYRGLVTLREALASSINTVAVQVSEQTGRDKVIAAARRLGITAPLRSHPSLALGANEVTLLELTAAYATIPNGGWGVWSYGISEIRDNAGHVLYRRSGSGPGRVVASVQLKDLNDMLAETLIKGTGRGAAIDRPAAGKTGTSQDFRDAWFIGYTTDLVTGVWVGNDDGTPMKRVTGGGLPAHIWRAFMIEALNAKMPRTLPVLSQEIPILTGRPRPR